MRKKELIALHQLLREVRITLEDRGEIDPGEFEEYDALDVESNHVHCGKADHEEAVWALLDVHEEVCGGYDSPDADPRLAAIRS